MARKPLTDVQKKKRAERCRQYRASRKSEIAEQNRQYRESHKDEEAERNRQYYESHKSELAEYQRQYRESHKDELAEWNRQYRANWTPEQKEIEDARQQSRREYGYSPINRWFEGSAFHHLWDDVNDTGRGIYIPQNIHNIQHDHNDPESMIEINKLAYDFLEEQQEQESLRHFIEIQQDARTTNNIQQEVIT